ncbi:MAG: hypothetical protein HDT39_16855 [Lachnospiraceae bacterium]|nr:hypothetical protein [Lachnospiraceae bacterium]
MKKIIFRYKCQIIIFLSIIIFKSVFNLSFSALVQVAGADEFGTIAGAALFAGLDWSGVVKEISYYGFGYSMFMAPLFLLTDDPVVIFRCMLAFNTICIAVSGIVIYNIIKNIFKIDNEVFAVLSALAGAMWSENMLKANAVYNEACLVLIGLLELYILLRMQEKRDRNESTLRLTVILSLIMSYSLLVHTRSLYLWGAIVIFILTYLIMKRKLLVNPAALASICVFGYLISKYVINKVQSTLWYSADSTKELNNSVESLGGYFTNVKYLGTIDGLKGFFNTIIGQIYGMITISGGLFAVFIAIIICAFIGWLYCIIKHKKIDVDEKMVTIGMFTVSFLGAAICLTALGISNVTSHFVAADRASRWYLYVRYWSMVGSIMVMFTLVALYKKFHAFKEGALSDINRTVACSVTVFVFETVYFLTLLAPGFKNYKSEISNVFSSYISMGFLKFGDNMVMKAFVTMSIFAAVCFLMILICLKKKKVVPLVVISLVLSLYNYSYTSIRYDKVASDMLYNEFSDLKEEIDNLGIEENSTIYLNVGHTKKYKHALLDEKTRRAYVNAAQFWFSRYSISLEYPDFTRPAVVITNKDITAYKKAGFKEVYSHDTELFNGVRIFYKSKKSKVKKKYNKYGETTSISQIYE